MKRNIMKVVLFSIMVLLHLNNAFGQSRGLKINDKMPKLNKVELIGSTMELSKKPSVVIYDFFDTYCVSCIESMPKLKALQKKLGAEVQIYMVTWQDRATIEKFYQNNKFLKEKDAILPTIINDKQLKALFPHAGVPHVAVVKNGIVRAVTFSDFITVDGINELLRKDHIKASLKDDYMQLSDVKNNASDGIASVVLKGYSEDWPQWEGIQETKTSAGTTKITLSNNGILRTYKALLSRIKKPTYLLGSNRIIWDNVNRDVLDYPENTGGIQKWLTQYGICYERKSSIPMDSVLMTHAVINDLNLFLGLDVRFEKRRIPCLILQEDETGLRAAADPNDGRQGMEGTGVLTFLVDYSGLFPPVYDEVNKKDRIKLGDFTNLEELNKQMQGQGLKFVEGEREMEVLVVSKR
ncbi:MULTISPECIES: TlpA family protein disulfide reductase [Sphingobacterium]|uniref:TlpA family protein disulfide reductase n=1 Tax=Sphingobacterium TaxID=28453 RepID=UPI00257A17FC|nr:MULTISPECIES: hypothetical protein [Sphingobacterium]